MSEAVDGYINSISSSDIQNDHNSIDDTLLENTNNDENGMIETTDDDHSVEDVTTVKDDPFPENETSQVCGSDYRNDQGAGNNIQTQSRSATNYHTSDEQDPNLEWVLPINDHELGRASFGQNSFEDLPNNQIPNDQPVRHRVEWIYPDEYSGRYSSVDGQTNVDNRNSSNNEERVDYVVDPDQVYIILEVEGHLVNPKRCFIKVFGSGLLCRLSKLKWVHCMIQKVKRRNSHRSYIE